MTEKEAQMTSQSGKAAAKPDPAVQPYVNATTEVSGPPERAGEEFRQEWADANGADPAEMREIHYPGGWVDHFDGRGWVQEGS